jgi:hypothetical protein
MLSSTGIDEIQSMLGGPLLKQRQFLNAIKHPGNELQIPIVAAWHAGCLQCVQTDPQLANRFEPILLRRWTMVAPICGYSPGSRPLERRSGFVEPASALKTLSLSEGTSSV